MSNNINRGLAGTDVQHTYIFENSAWKCEGVYYQGEQAVPMEGMSYCLRDKAQWKVHNIMKVSLSPPLRFINNYDITIEKSTGLIRCISENEQFGRLEGMITVTGKTILLGWESKEGYHGQEILTQCENGSYHMVSVTSMPLPDVLPKYEAVLQRRWC